jgi:hypothetical protein
VRAVIQFNDEQRRRRVRLAQHEIDMKAANFSEPSSLVGIICGRADNVGEANLAE